MLNNTTTSGGNEKEMIESNEKASPGDIDVMPEHLQTAVRGLPNAEDVFYFIAKMTNEAYEIDLNIPSGLWEAIRLHSDDNELNDEIWTSAIEHAMDAMLYSFKSILEDLRDELNSKFINELYDRIENASGSTVCHNCGYTWWSQGTNQLVTCPSCGRKTQRES